MSLETETTEELQERLKNLALPKCSRVNCQYYGERVVCYKKDYQICRVFDTRKMEEAWG